MSERMSVDKALQAVRESNDGLYGVLLENGSMELGYYKPIGVDHRFTEFSDDFAAWIVFYGPRGGEL